MGEHNGGEKFVVVYLKTGGFSGHGEEGNFIYVPWVAIVELEKRNLN